MTLARPPRQGLTLLEVVVAMAIFLVSLIAIMQLTFLGKERAMDAKLFSRASMLCQSKLAEVMIGVEALTSNGGYADYPNETNMSWKMEATEADVTGLWQVKIWVRAEMPTGRTVEAHLCQMVLDPTIRGSTLVQPATTTPSTAATPTGG